MQDYHEKPLALPSPTATATGPSAAIEKTFALLKWIESVLGREPTVVHIPAIRNREAQVAELEFQTQNSVSDARVVLRTTLPAGEVIRWPAKSWEAIIRPDGTVAVSSSSALHPPVSLSAASQGS